MNWKNIKIGKKLSIGFGAVLVLAIAIGYVGINGLNTISEKVANADDANRLVKWVKDTAVQRKDFAATKNVEDYNEVAEIVNSIYAQIDETKARFKDQNDIELIESIRKHEEEYLAGWGDMVRNQEDILKAVAVMDEAAIAVSKEVEALRQSQKEQMDKEFASRISHSKLQDRVGKADDANRLVKYILQTRIAWRNFRMTEEESYAEELNKVADDLLYQCELTKSKMNRQANIDQVNDIARGIRSYKDNFNKVVELKGEAQSIQNKLAELGLVAVEAMDKLRQGQKEKMQSAQSTAVTMAISFIIGALIIGSLVALVITRGITNPISLMVKAIDRLASGDLTHKVDINQSDEIGLMAKSLNKSIDQLHESMMTVARNTEQLVSAATEISSASEQLSAGSQEQTNQTTQVATAVEEMTSTIIESSRNTTEAAGKAQEAAEKSQHGSRLAEDTSRGMEDIVSASNTTASNITSLSEKATAIGEIIKVIDDIADQTNLLALNAAIEAARAGEQGRGFAVVADEVRKLAERTTKATKEVAETIKGIQSDVSISNEQINESQEIVNKGKDLVVQTNESLNEIFGAIESVQEMMRQIAAASEEQSSAAEQISRNVENVNRITKETATGTQQSAAAAEQLSRQAEELKNLIGTFQLRGETVEECSYDA